MPKQLFVQWVNYTLQPVIDKTFNFVGEGAESNHTSKRYPVSPMHHLAIDLPELTHPASPVGAPSNPERTVGTMNQVNSTNRNLLLPFDATL